MNDSGIQELRQRLAPQDQALFNGVTHDVANRFFRYLFSTPRAPDGTPRLRSLAIGLYDPFCPRDKYDLGILWQSSPYTCCAHACVYCYGRSYLHGFKEGAKEKKGFRHQFERCLDTMWELDLPPRHLSMANSSGLLQANLEERHGHALFMLESLCQHPYRFSSIGVLTKNPGMLLTDERYVKSCLELNLDLQVSLALPNDDISRRLEPGAPSPEYRQQAVKELYSKGVRVALRIDPLFPRTATVPNYQTREDLRRLVAWAADAGVSYIITSALKIPYRRNAVSWFNESLLPAFPVIKGVYRRMPPEMQSDLIHDLRAIAAEQGLEVEHCFKNILKRNRVMR